MKFIANQKTLNPVFPPLIFWKYLFALLILGLLQFPQAGFAQRSLRSGYTTLSAKKFVAEKQIQISTPKEVAARLFAKETETEGKQSEQILIEYPNNNGAIITYTVVGLADDSLAGVRYRIELKRNADIWRIAWVGQQTKCKPGRGHQDWLGTCCQ